MSLDLSVQRRIAAWRAERWSDTVHQTGLVAKAAEELGEMARAVISDLEGRRGRGDVVDEAAQVIVVLAALVGIHYPERDLFQAVLDELTRLGVPSSPE